MRIHGNKMTTTRMVSQARARKQGRGKILSSIASKSAAKTSTSSKSNSSKNTSSTTSSISSQGKKYDAYTEMESNAKKMQAEAKTLLKMEFTEKKADTELTEEEKKTQEEKLEKEKTTLVSDINKMVTYYNGLYESLEDTGAKVNLTFQTQLKNVVKEYEKKLKNVGISLDKTGTLSVTQKTLENADIEDLKNIFCTENGLSQKLADKADTLETNAGTTLRVLDKMYGTSYSSNYTKSGKTNNAYNYYKNWYSSYI